MSNNEITCDSNYMYLNQEKFFPILQETEACFDSLESVNGIAIYVNCTESSDFQWEEAYKLAEKAVGLGKWILWKLDFQFQEKRVFLEDTAVFYSCGIAIEEFVSKLAVPFQGSTIGASIFRGGVDFSKYFIWTDQHESHYLEKNKENAFFQMDPLLGDVSRKLFAADVFSDYLQRLASFFPENLLPFCMLDVSSVDSMAVLSFLLSKEKFQYLLLALKGSSIPLGCLNWEWGDCLGGWVGRGAPYFAAVHDVSLGVCIPLESRITRVLLEQIDNVFLELNRLKTPYRIISELYLTEGWDGIDDLIVFGSAVSRQGIRKLRGFLAAGGRVIHAEAPIGLESEISLLEFSGR